MGLLIKGLLDALMVALVDVLTKMKNYAPAGLIPLFPTFTLITHYIVANERGIEALHATIVFGIWSITPYFVYLVSLWYFTGIMRLPLALTDAVGCWGLCTWLLVPSWSHLYWRNGWPPSTAKDRPMT